ncbi:glycosyltransferase family 4 protein [Deinococcus marmoris]|uniref:Glycosyltransferase n=1 Tax=Deinococcus marmoris TaxID=249408 RepID=A0A1U7NSD6_9DEIO|nr:glycosyltransferase family 4 protein [Deinococcus marmoris]OLV15817.1 Glycosyltransferase [Deinococcus marmoris]
MGDIQLKRLKVLVSAYACAPGEGSEPGVGWNISTALSAYHDIVVLTRTKNKLRIENELNVRPLENISFVYYDLPKWVLRLKRGSIGVQVYYYLWQLFVFGQMKQLHQKNHFDVVHHLTFGKYWSPSLLSRLGPPMLWGPVGGAESTPPNLIATFGLRGKVYELIRTLARQVGERDPLVCRTIMESKVALTKAPETAHRLKSLGAEDVRIFSEAGFSDAELTSLGQIPLAPNRPFRFLSVARLLHWKGVQFGLEAFAYARLPNAEYWILGDGPERAALEILARRLGIDRQVRFFGQKPRPQVLEILSSCHVLVHASMHDSGGWASVEAMAAGRPVLCLDVGGPATQVVEGAGVKVAPISPGYVISRLAWAMRELFFDADLYTRMSEEARIHVQQHFSWQTRAAELADILLQLTENHTKARD